MQSTDEWLNQPGGLTERLGRMRRAAGLTGDQLATRLGWTRTKVPKLENGRQMPTEADIAAWAEACGQLGAAEELLRMLSQAQAVRRKWRHQLRAGHAAVQAGFDALVRGASRIRDFQIMLIPGLLQTPDYARYRALEAVRLHATDPERVEETVVARMRRQEVLYDTSKTFEFVITEAALRYLLCPPQVMRGQLDRLLGVIGLSHVMFGIIPPGRELAIAPMAGFLMADDVTVVETFTSADTLRGRESAKYGEIADGLMNAAVTGDDARRLIVAAVAALRVLRRAGRLGLLHRFGHALGPRVAVPGQQQVRVDPAQRVQRGERLGRVRVQPGRHDLRTEPAGERVLRGQDVAGQQDRRLSTRIAALPGVCPGEERPVGRRPGIDQGVLAGFLDQVEVRDAARQPVDALAHLHWLAFPYVPAPTGHDATAGRAASSSDE